MTTRREHDIVGELELPADALYGVHTARARDNFNLLGRGVHPELVRGLAEVKKACAVVNARLGYLDERRRDAIARACDEIIAGGHREALHTDAIQGGAGTSMNLAVCEVVANLANLALGGQPGDYDLVHPLDHVNLAQSTNDVVPTALRVAAIRLVRRAAAALAELQGALQEKERAFAGVLKLGRTELMDAVPITLGQEFAAWAQAISRDWWRMSKAEERLRQVNLGGTAVGTGLNADRRFVHLVVDELRALCGLPLARAENLIDATQNLDQLVEASGLAKAAATTLFKLAADLRLLGSGPAGGLGELRLPPLQAGSSIMPGKINPVACEAVGQAAIQIIAGDTAISFAAASGQLELNPFLPLVAHNLLLGLDLLAGAALLLARRCVRGLVADEARCRAHLEASTALVTALSPYVGYEEASRLAQEAVASGRTVRELAAASGHFSAEELARILDPTEMTHPGVAGLSRRPR